jgi:glutathione S-transferase
MWYVKLQKCYLFEIRFVEVILIYDTFAATPFGQLPMLEVDGVKLCQSNAIATFLALEFGKFHFDFTSVSFL